MANPILQEIRNYQAQKPKPSWQSVEKLALEKLEAFLKTNPSAREIKEFEGDFISSWDKRILVIEKGLDRATQWTDIKTLFEDAKERANPNYARAVTALFSNRAEQLLSRGSADEVLALAGSLNVRDDFIIQHLDQVLKGLPSDTNALLSFGEKHTNHGGSQFAIAQKALKASNSLEELTHVLDFVDKSAIPDKTKLSLISELDADQLNRLDLTVKEIKKLEKRLVAYGAPFPEVARAAIRAATNGREYLRALRIPFRPSTSEYRPYLHELEQLFLQEVEPFNALNPTPTPSQMAQLAYRRFESRSAVRATLIRMYLAARKSDDKSGFDGSQLFPKDPQTLTPERAQALADVLESHIPLEVLVNEFDHAALVRVAQLPHSSESLKKEAILAGLKKIETIEDITALLKGQDLSPSTKIAIQTVLDFKIHRALENSKAATVEDSNTLSTWLAKFMWEDVIVLALKSEDSDAVKDLKLPLLIRPALKAHLKKSHPSRLSFRHRLPDFFGACAKQLRRLRKQKQKTLPTQ